MKGIVGRVNQSPNNNPILFNKIKESFKVSENSFSDDLCFCDNAEILTIPNSVGRYSHAKTERYIASVFGDISWDSEKLSNLNSNSPGEALIESYKDYNENLLQHIHGHFAISVYDIDEQKLLIAIDRIGVKTIAYSLLPNNDGLVFGSSIDNLFLYPGVENKVNPQSLFNYIYFHVIPSPDTVYKNIHKLEPAQFLCYENNKVRTDYYWQPQFKNSTQFSFPELKQQLKNNLEISVNGCHPNEQTGSFLSGGLDSSTVTGVLKNIKPDTAKAFSIGFSQEGYDEMEFARAAAEHFDVDLVEYYVTTDDINDTFIKLISAFDEPFGNSSAIPAYFCAKLAKDNGYTKLMAGDGGDEIFAGNTRYQKQYLFNMYHSMPALLRKLILEPVFYHSPLSKSNPINRKIRSYIQQARIDMPERMETYNLLHRTDINTVFEPEFLKTINSNHPLELLQNRYSQIDDCSLLDNMLFLDWKFTLADNDLRKVGNMCDLAGISVEYPLLSDELMDFSASIPPKLKMTQTDLRHFFKTSLNDFLPQKVINKSKHGFGLPFGEWLKSSDHLQNLIYGKLENLGKRGIVRQDFISQLISTHKNGHAAYFGTFVWVFAVLETWLEQRNLNI